MITQRQLFLQHVAQTSPSPLALEIERAEGMYMYDTEGKKYMDLIAGISVSNLGHSHPAVVKAVQKQAETYMHLMVYGEYIQSPQVQLAKLLTDQLPEQLNSVYFVNSGSEAIEGALKLAKRYTGRTRIISMNKAYHGSTHGALSVIGEESFRRGFRPLLPDVYHVDFNDLSIIDMIDENTACVLLEPFQGEAGIRLPEEGYLKAIRQRCTETGTLLIFDEVQTGYGRTGSLFAFEQCGVVPDIMTLAKGMGGGMPLGAFVSNREILQCLTSEPVLGHITTYGGHAVSCAAGLATLNTLLNTNLIEEAQKKEQLFRELLIHPDIKEIRGKGLFLAIQFESASKNFEIIEKCIKQGIITDWFLFADDCLRIAPPLIISESEISEACKIILSILQEKY